MVRALYSSFASFTYLIRWLDITKFQMDRVCEYKCRYELKCEDECLCGGEDDVRGSRVSLGETTKLKVKVKFIAPANDATLNRLHVDTGLQWISSRKHLGILIGAI